VSRNTLLTGSIGGVMGAITAIIGMLWSTMTLQLAIELAEYPFQLLYVAITNALLTPIAGDNQPLAQPVWIYVGVLTTVLVILFIVSGILTGVGFYGVYQNGGGRMGVVGLLFGIAGSIAGAIFFLLGGIAVQKYGIGVNGLVLSYNGTSGYAILGITAFYEPNVLFYWIGLIILAATFIILGVSSIAVHGATGRPVLSLISGISSIAGACLLFPFTLYMLENLPSTVSYYLSGNAALGIESTFLGFIPIFVANILWVVVFFSSRNLIREPVQPEIRIKNTTEQSTISLITNLRSTTTRSVTNCLYCGSEIPKNAKVCPSCGAERVKCSVCNLDIITGEFFVKCPHCGALSHRDHLLEWVKIRGTCPNCKKKLSEIEIS
jgi:hypothetical protein